MRSTHGGNAHLAGIIEEDLSCRKTWLQKPQRVALSDLVCCALFCRSANTGEWIHVLSRNGCDEDARERYIQRFLSNPLVDPIRVMQGFVPDILETLASNGQIVILMLDQSKIRDGFECLMVSLRLGERAIPVAWRVVGTRGAIGFKVQEQLLNRVFEMVPQTVQVLLSADRFYGTVKLILWCQKHHWQYRIRLKGNLILNDEDCEIKTGEAAKMGMQALQGARLGKKTVTHIGIIHEAGHREPWIIAMDETPTVGRTLDYGMRWGIEALFSDMKSRGFGITQTHLKHAERIERLLLVLAIATYWAVSTGMEPRSRQRQYTKKKSNAL